MVVIMAACVAELVYGHLAALPLGEGEEPLLEKVTSAGRASEPRRACCPRCVTLLLLGPAEQPAQPLRGRPGPAMRACQHVPYVWTAGDLPLICNAPA